MLENQNIRFLEELSENSNEWHTRAYLLYLERHSGDFPDRGQSVAALIRLCGTAGPEVVRLSASLAGKLIVTAGEESEELFEDVVRKLLFDAERGNDRSLRIEALRCVLARIEAETDSETSRKYFGSYARYFKSSRWGKETSLRLVSAVKAVSPSVFSPLERHEIFGFLRLFLSGEDTELRAEAFDLIRVWKDRGWNNEENEERYLESLKFTSDNREQNFAAEGVDFRTGFSSEATGSHTVIFKGNAEAYTGLLNPEEKLAFSEELEKRLIQSEAGETLPLVRLCIDILKNTEAEKLAGETEKKAAGNIVASVSRALFAWQPEISETALFLTADLLEKTPSVPGRADLLRRCRLALKRKGSGRFKYALKVAEECLANIPESEGEYYSGRKIAFFADSFDPFTKKDRAIVEALTERGFHVVIYPHEFDPGKMVQPEEIRRQICSIALADVSHVSLYQSEYPVNVSNSADLIRLKNLYKDSEVYLVKSAESLEKTDAYWTGTGEGAPSSFPHVIISDGIETDLAAIKGLVQAEVVLLSLPEHMRHMNAGEVQRKIQNGESITGLVDEQVRNMISEWRLYIDKPAYRKEISARPVSLTLNIINEAPAVPARPDAPDEAVWEAVLRDESCENPVLASVCFHKTGIGTLYDECKDFEVCSMLENRLSGHVAVIHPLSVLSDAEDVPRLILTELLSYLQIDFSYSLVLNPGKYRDEYLRFGFIPLPGHDEVLYVDMRRVQILFLDVLSGIRESFSELPEIREEVTKGRKRLFEALCRLYPGNLLLPLHTDILNYSLVKLLKKNSLTNPVCVPFGKILKGAGLEDIYTKELYTEKVYESDLSTFNIREFPGYPSLVSQIRTIASLGRQVVLVDDLLHKGYRLEKIEELLKDEGLNIDLLLVSVMSGRGRDLSKKHGIAVECAHFIPGVRCWFQESDLYPYVGGDGIDTGRYEDAPRGLLPSLNSVLPFQMPSYLKDAPHKAVYELSLICLDNSARIFEALEKHYEMKYHRTLTAERLPEVMTEPRYPAGSLGGNRNTRRISTLIREKTEELARIRRAFTE